jgi:GT2 family glycosyltransferase
MKSIATIILNRNLPEVTDNLYEHLVKYDGTETDIYVLEAGSDKDKLSKYCTWYANSDEIVNQGLRYSRGMNYALLQLYKEKKWKQYNYFFLLTNDTVLSREKTLAPMNKLLKEHQRVGILSPCSLRWGERFLLQETKTKYFWFIHNNALFLRRNFIETIMEIEKPNYFNFLFDGSNFRGYFSESELIAKAYVNNWAAAITAEVFAEHNESYLLNKADLIKTETYDKNVKLYIEEGQIWLRRKYGFNSRWSMQQYAKSFYESFFDFYPEYKKYKI